MAKDFPSSAIAPQGIELQIRHVFLHGVGVPAHRPGKQPVPRPLVVLLERLAADVLPLRDVLQQVAVVELQRKPLGQALRNRVAAAAEFPPNR